MNIFIGYEHDIYICVNIQTKIILPISAYEELIHEKKFSHELEMKTFFPFNSYPPACLLESQWKGGGVTLEGGG